MQNIRLHQGDARDVIARLPSVARSGLHPFPDPWPKTRHWKRRLIQPEFLDDLARVLKPGGEVRFATDWEHYAAGRWSRSCAIRALPGSPMRRAIGATLAGPFGDAL